MGQRGPLPKPTARKRLEGNPGHRPLPSDEPEPRLLAERPKPPDWLPARACDAWHLVTTELQAAGMLAALDLPILEMYCLAYAHWRDMVEAVRQEGYTQRFYDSEGNMRYAQATPEATLVSKFAADCNRWAKVLGLGPAYRVGLRIGRDPKQPNRDPIADALSGAGLSTTDAAPPPRKAAKQKAARKKAPVKKKAVKKKAAKRTSKRKETADKD